MVGAVPRELAGPAGWERAARHKELLVDWPVGQEPPSARVLYEWLSRAAGEGLVVRTGGGTRTEPFRFRLPNEMDEMLARLRPHPEPW